MLELSHFTGREGFGHAAEQCLRYQQSGFDAESEHPSKAPDATVESASWSDGASGIGMTRLRAFEQLGDEIYLSQGKAALQTVETLCGSSSQTTQQDFSLAQGLTGSAELLLYAHHTLKDESLKATAERIGREGIERYANLPWPCATPGGAETPNLMLGLAGIGYFYLRLYDAIQTFYYKFNVFEHANLTSGSACCQQRFRRSEVRIRGQRKKSTATRHW